MKIAILCEYLSYVGGGERVYCSWANIFSDILGHDVTIVAMEDVDKSFYKLSQKVKIHSLKLRQYKFYQNPKKRKKDMILNYWSDRKIIEKYLNESNFDVVIGIALNINLILSKIKGKFKKIATEHSEYYAPNKLLRNVRNQLYKAFDVITVLNYQDLHLFKKHNPNTIVLLNPVEVLNHDNPRSSSEKKLIVSVGSLSHQKNQKDLISMMEIIHKDFKDWKLIIYGEGPLHDELQYEVDKRNLNECITLAGVSENVPKSISEGSIFVLSSIIEGFGLVLIEAMSTGIPCVSYNTAGPDMIIDNDYNGIKVECGNIEDLTQSVISLINDPQKRERLGLNGLNSIQKFHPKEIAKDWHALFESLYANGKSVI